MFNTGIGQHILKNPLIVNSIIDKVGVDEETRSVYVSSFPEYLPGMTLCRVPWDRVMFCSKSACAIQGDSKKIKWDRMPDIKWCCVYVLNELSGPRFIPVPSVACFVLSSFLLPTFKSFSFLWIIYLVGGLFFFVLAINFKIISSLFGGLLLVCFWDWISWNSGWFQILPEPALNLQASVILTTF